MRHNVKMQYNALELYNGHGVNPKKSLVLAFRLTRSIYKVDSILTVIIYLQDK